MHTLDLIFNIAHESKRWLLTLLLIIAATAGCVSISNQTPFVEEDLKATSVNEITRVEVIVPDPEARFGAVAFNIQEKYILLGGLNLDGEYLSIEEFNPATSKWNTVSPLPTPRIGFAAVELDGSIYIIGGRNNTDVLSVVERYDPILDSWTKLSNIPTGRWNLMAAAIGDRIYTIGGITGIGGQRYSVDLVEVYDPVTDIWTELDRAPFRRSGASVAVLMDNLYVIGGRPEAGSATSITARVDIYDPQSQVWAQAKPLAEARTGSCVVSANDKIYAIAGGAGPNKPLASVEVYDLETEEWTTITGLTEPRTLHACMVIDNSIYVMGGATSQSPPALAKSIELVKISP